MYFDNVGAQILLSGSWWPYCWDKKDKGVKEENTGLSITSGIIISSNDRLGIVDQNSLTRWSPTSHHITLDHLSCFP